MDNNYVTVSKIKWYAMKVLPLVYDDSLSYYEILSKVATKVNNLIENDEQEIQALEELSASVEGLDTRVTKNTDDISELETALENAITTLEEYVQNYVTDPEHFADNPLEGYILTVTDEGTLEWVSPYSIIGSLPEGGTTGQALVKHSDTDFDTEWNGYVAPDGGTEGQVLMKNSDENGDIGWGDVTEQGTIPTARLIPSGGNEGDVLVKVSDENYDVAWDTGFKPQIIVSAENGSTVQVGQQVTETADIISYNSATKSLIGLTANIKARQDLHNLPYPYPPGGDKNLIPMTVSGIKALNTNGTWSDNNYTFRGIVWTILSDSADNVIGIRANQTATQNSYFDVGVVSPDVANGKILNGCPASGSASTYFIQATNNSNKSVNDYGSGVDIADFPSTPNIIMRVTVVSGYAASNLTFYPMLSTSGGAFAPYSNVCPIVGYTSANITRAGKQLLDPATKNVISSGGTPLTVRYYTDADPFLFKSGHTYSIEYKDNAGARLYFIKANGSAIVATQSGYQKLSYTFTEDTYGWVQFVHTAQEGAILTDDEYFVMHIGDATEDYEAYNGTTFNISWSDDAGTVYFGTLTYQGNSIWKLVVLGTTAQYTNSTGFADHSSNRWYHAGLPSGASTVEADRALFICNQAKNYNEGNVYMPYFTVGGSGFYVNKLSAGETLADLTARWTDSAFVLCYPLATPIEYTLTEDALTELVGANNIFTDVGDITAVLDSYKNGTEVSGKWTFNVNSYGVYKVRAIKNNITKNAIVTVDTVKQYPVDLT